MSEEIVERVRKVVEIIKRDERRGTVVKFVGTWEYNHLSEDILDGEVSAVLNSIYKNEPLSRSKKGRQSRVAHKTQPVKIKLPPVSGILDQAPHVKIHK